MSRLSRKPDWLDALIKEFVKFVCVGKNYSSLTLSIMKYLFYVTTEKQKYVSKLTLSKVIADRLESDLTSNQKLSAESNTSSPRVKVQRMNIASGPRMIFFEKVRDDTTLYVLRKIYTDHDSYIRDFNNVPINFWLTCNLPWQIIRRLCIIGT